MQISVDILPNLEIGHKKAYRNSVYDLLVISIYQN